MFAALMMGLNNWMERLERQRRDAYLSESSDIVELEHRIRTLETRSFNAL
jgi:Protein of unknown function (DUF3563)